MSVRLPERFATKTLDLIDIQFQVYGRRDTSCAAQCRAIGMVNNKQYGRRPPAPTRPPSRQKRVPIGAVRCLSRYDLDCVCTLSNEEPKWLYGIAQLQTPRPRSQVGQKGGFLGRALVHAGSIFSHRGHSILAANAFSKNVHTVLHTAHLTRIGVDFGVRPAYLLLQSS